MYLYCVILPQDFATSSLKGEVALENADETIEDAEDLEEYQINDRKHWEQRYHFSSPSIINVHLVSRINIFSCSCY